MLICTSLNLEGKNIKKRTNRILFTLLVLFAIIGLTLIAFQSRFVQTRVIGILTQKISEQTGSEVSINRVKIGWFNKVILDDIFIGDMANDTLFYTKRLEANVDSLFVFKKRLHFKSIAFKDALINVYRADSMDYNFNYLLKAFETDTSYRSQSEWRFFCNRFELENGRVQFEDDNLSTKVIDLANMEKINLIIDNAQFLDPNHARFNIETLNIDNPEAITLDQFTMEFNYSDSIASLNQIKGKTTYSDWSIRSFNLDLRRFLKSKQSEHIKFDIDISDVDFGLNDIAFVVEDKYIDGISTNVSGKLSGNLSDIRGKDFRFSVANFTHLFGDFYLNGMDDLESAYLFVNLNESFANLNEIRNLDLPPFLRTRIESLPSFLNNVGAFNYEGNFTGFIDDFVAFGTVYSDLGEITCDISFSPDENNAIDINGKIATNHLNINRIFDNDNLGYLTLNGEVDGIIDDGYYDIGFKGSIDTVDFNNYRLRKIELNGNIKQKQFIGQFTINDPNLKMDFNGKFDMLDLPEFEFVANIKQFKLKQLKLIDDYGANLSLRIDANFKGNSIDNVLGHLNLNDIKYNNYNHKFAVDSFKIGIQPENNQNVVKIESDIVEGEVVGMYNLINLGKSLTALYKHYLPSSISTTVYSNQNLANEFKYNFFVKDINEVLNLLVPGLYVEPNFDIEGEYSFIEKKITLDTKIQYLYYNNQKIDDINISVNSDAMQLISKVKLGQLSLARNFNIYNLTLNSSAQNDNLDLDLFWNNFGEKTYSAKLQTKTSFSKSNTKNPHIKFLIEPSNVYFGDSLWNLDETVINIDSTSININKLNFYHGNQRFFLDGTIAKNKTDQVYAKIENIDFTLFEPLMGASYFEGQINGEADLSDFYNKMMLNLNLNVDNFTFDNGYLGEFKLSSNWNNKTERLNSTINLANNGTQIIQAQGDIDVLNSALDLKMKFDHSPINFLQVLMPSTFNNQGGMVDGDIHLHGDLMHLKHDGFIKPVDRISMGLKYLNTNYSTYDPIYFVGDSIVFRNTKIFDKDGNLGMLNGMISHQTFRNMVYDIHVKTNKILALNTSSIHNDQFYGTAYASGIIDIIGEGDEILLSGNVRSEKGTSLFIPFESSESAERYDFIEFVNYKIESETANVYDVVTSGFDMNFDLEITPEAKVQIIFNSQMGDIIKGIGNGDLQVRVDRNYDIEIFGNYEIEEGDYLFTLKNVLNKRFSILNGSSIEWSGDPYNALIDINANYKVKTTLDDLFLGTNQEIDLTRRIPVDCGIHLTENLLKPKIEFSIDLPTVEERVKDEVSQLIVTDEEKNKQIISLLMLGRFYTPEFFAGKQTTETGTNLVGTTASELLSNQLSNWLSKISDSFDLGINYRPGNETTTQQIELALSTQLLNDRVTFDYNVANNSDPNSANTSQIIGEFDLNVKLTDNGKIQLKVYNHSNDNIMIDMAPSTTGVGLSYREEFNSLPDLWNRFKEAILPNKRKKKQQN